MQELDSKEEVVFLHPKETEDGFYIETGWTSVGNKIKVPIIIWEIVPQPPVSPPSSKNLCGNQYIPHAPAEMAKAIEIL